MTKAEIWLWARLKTLRADGWHFRRQAPYRGYFLDFVCYAARIVIEVDGAQHGEPRQAEHDGVRDAILTRDGFRVLRFWNGQILSNLEGVVDVVLAELGAPRPASPPRSPVASVPST